MRLKNTFIENSVKFRLPSAKNHLKAAVFVMPTAPISVIGISKNQQCQLIHSFFEKVN